MGIRNTKYRGAFLTCFAIAVTMAGPARAELNQDINLVQQKGLLLQSQTDSRWGGWYIGPADQIVVDPNPLTAISMARCGCLLTSLSSAIRYMFSGQAGLPWYYHPTLLGGLDFGQDFTFSPKYLDLFFNIGPNKSVPRSVGWGFQSGGGTTCGTEIKSWAASGIVNPARDPLGNPLFGTGVEWNTLTWSAIGRKDIDNNLLKGLPTVIVRKNSVGGGHANLIVGWHNIEKKYLIYDPMWSPNIFDGGAEAIAGTDYRGSNKEDRYTNYLKDITAVLPMERTTSFGAWMAIYDDPEPIRLMLIDPRLRKTGFDPTTGTILQERKESSYSEFTSFVDPVGTIPEAPPFIHFTIRDPEPGVYGLKVLGTGNGPFKLTIANVLFDQQEDVAVINGTITTGATQRYEITRQANGAVSYEAVTAFHPQAKAGNNASAYMNDALAFDGRGSQQMEGTITGYQWDFGDGENGSGAQQTHTYDTPGSYTATLTVTNSSGLTNSDTRTVNVVDPLLSTLSETILVSVADDESLGNGPSWFPQVTPNGRYVVFHGHASNLVPNDNNGTEDVFVRDIELGTTERVSVSSAGVEANGFGSNRGNISADGRYVTFLSSATNLVAGVTTPGLYLRDRTAGTTEFIGRADNGQASLSADGRYIAFASPYIPDDTGPNNVIVHDRVLGTNEVVGIPYGGKNPKISADGNLVAYQADFGPDELDFNSTYSDIWLRDRVAGTTELVSRNLAGDQFSNLHSFNASMSSDGRYVAFDVSPTAYDGYTGYPAPAVKPNLYVRDRLMGTTVQVNTDFTDTGPAFSGVISPNGRSVAFLFTPTFSLANPINVFLHDLQSDTIELTTVDIDGNQTASLPIYSNVGVTNDNGVVFWGNSPNLVENDPDFSSTDVFLRRRVPGTGGATIPLANLGGPYIGWTTSVEVPTGIRLDGSSSVDPQNRALTAHWDFGDGTPAIDDGLTVTHAYDKPGIYQVTLTVNAGTDVSESVQTEVEVLPELPGADLSISACAAPGGTLSIDGAAPDVNADLIAQGWDTSTGPLQTAPVEVNLPWGSVQVPTELPGLTFKTSVTVPDAFANGSYATDVTEGGNALFDVPCVPDANLPPIAVAGGPLYQAIAARAIALNGTGSSDPEGQSLSYAWDFGDDSTGTGPNPEHAYAFPGNYLVKLIVNDGTQNSSRAPEMRSYALVAVTEALCPDGETPESAGCQTGEVQPDSSVQFHVDADSVSEDAGSITIQVDRSGDTSVAGSIDYQSADGSAAARFDYAAVSGTLEFAPGVSSLSFAVPIFDNRNNDDNRSFTVILSNPRGNVVLGTPASETITILDDEVLSDLRGAGCSLHPEANNP